MAAENAKAGAQAAGDSPELGADASPEDVLGGMVVADDDAVEETDESVADDAGSDEPDEADADDDLSDDAEGDESDEDEDGEEDPDEDGSEDSDEDSHEAEAKAKMSARVTKRINKLTAQRNEEREKREALEKRVASMEEKSNANIPLEADYLSADEIRQIKEANDMITRREWLLEHVGIGYEDDADESKSMSAKDVAKELARLDRYSEEIVDAQRIFRERKRQMIEDMKAGRQLRLSKAAVKQTKEKKPPLISAKPKPASVPKKQPSTQGRRGFNMERFQKNGADEDAAARELSELVP